MSLSALAGRAGVLAPLLVLLALVLFSSVARPAESDSLREEILAAFRVSVLPGYQERDAEKVLALYDSQARIATITRGVLDKEAFGTLLRERFGQAHAMEVTLEFGEFALDGNEALVRFRQTVAVTNPDGIRRVATDRLYCRMKKTSSWKVVTQTYREDFALPPDTSAPGLHHEVGAFHP